jgi:hypothetical protein
MIFSQKRFRVLAAAGIGGALSAGSQVWAQDVSTSQGKVTSRDEITPYDSARTVDQHVADGQRHGLPVETYAVVPGTRFLVRLEQDLNTKEVKQNQAFRVRTLEPLEAGGGIYLPSGVEIRGHVSRVEPAGVTGKAKLWLTFDELQARFGALPIVADVVSVPGDHSIRSGPLQEGVIEGRSGTQKDATQAAAAGAATGAVKGVKDKNKKEAAEGAALGAIAAYLMESGRGEELELPKGAKLELELGRALYLVKE